MTLRRDCLISLLFLIDTDLWRAVSENEDDGRNDLRQLFAFGSCAGKENEFTAIFNPSQGILKPQLAINMWEAMKGILKPRAKSRCTWGVFCTGMQKNRLEIIPVTVPLTRPGSLENPARVNWRTNLMFKKKNTVN